MRPLSSYFKTRLLPLVAVVFLSAPALANAQTFVRLLPASATGTLDSTTTSVVLSSNAIGSFGTVKVQTLDSYSGTWAVQCSLDGTNFTGTLRLSITNDSTVVTSVTDTIGVWDVLNASGCRSIRVVETAGFVATNVTVDIEATQISSGSGAAGGAIGAVTQSGTWTVQPGNTANTTAWLFAGGKTTNAAVPGATNIGALTCVANAAAPTLTETFLTACSQDLKGAQRETPMDSGGSTMTDTTAHAMKSLLVDSTGATVPFGTLDPCEKNTKVYTPISQTTNTQIVTGTSSKKTYLCSIFIVGADAENMSLVAGTGSVCATNTVAVVGGATAAAGPNFAANSGWVQGNGASSIAATTVNADNLCLFQSGSGRVAGVISSVVQ